ncbi:hypothetical protein ACFOY2_53360 [Nonomuraea purpurea]|uniref:Uncharacterized protein n=1 Tax=Nonomuraea purpurea TaxID=1849276 RepID=A0ABV8GT01_9ACTN
MIDDEKPRCFSAHPMPAAEDCEELNWIVPRQEERLVRVIAWTCDCAAIFYELCQTGGLRFIRRNHNKQGTWTIAESDRWPARQAAAQWTALLLGHLR